MHLVVDQYIYFNCYACDYASSLDVCALMRGTVEQQLAILVSVCLWMTVKTHFRNQRARSSSSYSRSSSPASRETSSAVRRERAQKLRRRCRDARSSVTATRTSRVFCRVFIETRDSPFTCPSLRRISRSASTLPSSSLDHFAGGKCRVIQNIFAFVKLVYYMYVLCICVCVQTHTCVYQLTYVSNTSAESCTRSGA